jgi:hypothetical protein
MAIIVRYALTPNEPNLLPAEVKRIELKVQRHDVRIAADSPTRPESKFLTVRIGQNGPDDLKPFPRCVQFGQNSHHESARALWLHLKDKTFEDETQDMLSSAYKS